VLIGFESEEDWLEYCLENDPRFLRRIEQARSSLHAGRGLRLEDVETDQSVASAELNGAGLLDVRHTPTATTVLHCKRLSAMCHKPTRVPTQQTQPH
jgi:hypothetical protein